MPDQLEDGLLREGEIFNKGYMTDPPSIVIPEAQGLSSVLKNADPFYPLIMRKRNGLGSYQNLGATDLFVNDNSHRALIAIANWSGTGAVYSYHQGTISAATAMRLYQDGTRITNIELTGTSYQLVQGGNYLFLIRDAGNIHYIDLVGASTTLVDAGSGNTNFPTCQHALYTSQGRMLATNFDTESMYYSNALDVLTWNRTTNLKTITGGKARGLTGMLESQKNLMLMAKPDSFVEIDISSPIPGNWQSRMAFDGVGIPRGSERGLVDVAGQFFFLGPDGLYSLNELKAGVYLPVSYPVKSDFDPFVNYVRRFDTTLTVYRGCVFVINKTLSYVMVYDTNARRWMQMTQAATMLSADCHSSSSINTDGIDAFALMYHASDTRKRVSIIDENTTPSDFVDGSITITRETRSHNFGSLDVLKSGEFLEIMCLAEAASPGSIAVKYQINENGTWTALAESPMLLTGTAGAILTKKFSLSPGAIGNWRTIKFQFVEATAARCTIVSYSVFARLNNQELSGAGAIT